MNCKYCKANCASVGEDQEKKSRGYIPMTNADRIRAMTDDELSKFIESMVDGSNSHEVACYGCINYGTHHSDPQYKGTYLYDCEGCNSEGVGLDVKKWLQKHAEAAEAAIKGEPNG